VYGVWKSFFGAGAPAHRDLEPSGQFEVAVERPTFLGPTGKWMDNCEISPDCGRAVDVRNRRADALGTNLLGKKIGDMHWRILSRNGCEKLERQTKPSYQFAKFRPVRAVPGNDGIEASQFLNQSGTGRKLQHVQTGRGNGTCPGSKTGQRQVRRCGPNLYKISL